MNDYHENHIKQLSIDHENMELAEGLFNLASVSNNDEYYHKAIAIVIRSAKYTMNSENNLAKLQCYYFIKKYNIYRKRIIMKSMNHYIFIDKIENPELQKIKIIVFRCFETFCLRGAPETLRFLAGVYNPL